MTLPNLEVIAVVVAATGVGLAVHESGHWLAARMLGYDARIVLSWRGPGTRWAARGQLVPARDRALVAAAGPVASVAAAAWMVGCWPPCWPLAVVVANVGLVQLVPLPHSDGVKLLRRAALMR